MPIADPPRSERARGRARSARLVPRIALVALALLLTLAAGTAGAQDDAAQRLAERHAPVMMLVAQEEPCDTDGEQYAPTSVDIVLDNPEVFLRQVGASNPVLMNGAAASDVHRLGGGFYLDFPGDALAPGCIYERDFRKYSAGRPPLVYAHVARQADQPGRLALQYWVFWYYNDWNNKHEGDWEMIQVVFDVGSVEEALATDPVATGYSQHEGGERAGWDDDKLERRGTHPVVYPSRGSHASYYGSALYLGRSASEGFGCDDTDGPSVTLDPEVVVLPDDVADPGDPLAWLTFDGRWGERQSGPFNGPTGPRDKDRWSRPFDWQDDLRSASTVVPAGDEAGAATVNAFCGVVGWGSNQLIRLKTDPLPLLVAVAILFVLVSVLVARTDWSRVRPLPIARRRRIGQMIVSAPPMVRSRPLPFLEVGLIYIPISVSVGLIVALVERIPLIGSLLPGDGRLGPAAAILTLVVGGITHAIGFVLVIAAVAVVMHDTERGVPVSGRAAFRRVIERRKELLSALARMIVIVGVLLVSVVGIPWGIRQLVRYQLVAPVVMLEGAGGQAALGRSTRLVRGRWFHTAVIVAAVNGLVGVVASAVGLLLLVALTSIPLWAFSILVTASSALVVCFGAVAFVMLYGDARAEQEGLAPAEPLRGAPGTVRGARPAS